MSEIIGKELGMVHAGIEVKDGKFFAGVSLDGNDVIDLACKLASSVIPGDSEIEKAGIEGFRALAKEGLAKISAPKV